MAQDRAQALQARLLALAGNAKAPEPEPTSYPAQELRDGSHEQARLLVQRELGATVERELRLTEAGWMDARTGELVP